MTYNICGRVLKTHGLKGEVKVLDSSDFQRFKKGKTIFYKEDDKYIPLVIKDVKEGRPLIISFTNFSDINQVMFLIGKDLYAKREANELKENEYYYSDLINKEIYNTKGSKRSVCKDVILLPQGHYLVCFVDGKRKLIPFNEHFIVEVKEDRIIIDEIEGLL